MAVDHADHWGSEATGDEIVQAALPGLERLAPAKLQRHELLLPIGENGDHPQDRDAGDLPGAPDPQRDGVEVEVKHVHVRQRPGAPCLQLRLERAHDPRDSAFREGRRFEEWAERSAEPAGVAPGQIGRHHGLVDLAQPALVAGHQGRRPFLGVHRGEQCGARQCEGQRSRRPGHRARAVAVAIAAAADVACVAGRAQRGRQFLLDRHLDRTALTTAWISAPSEPGRPSCGRAAFLISFSMAYASKEVAPKISRVAVLWDSSGIHEGPSVKVQEVVARKLGITLMPYDAKSLDELTAAMTAITRERADGLFVFPNFINGKHEDQILDFATTHRLPTMFQGDESVEAGGLMSYYTNWLNLRRRAATYVDRILKGAKPGELPVEQPTKFDLVINLKIAKASVSRSRHWYSRG